MKIGELFVQLGVNADTVKVKDFAKSIGEIPLAVGAALTSLAGIGLTFGELTGNALTMAKGLRVFTAETGLSARELQKWEVVAKQVGLSGDVVESSLRGITSALARMRLGDVSAARPLSFLGIRGARNAQDVLEQLRRNTGRLPRGVEAQLLGQIGVNPEMMRVFQLPGSSFNRMMSRGPILSEHALAVLDRFQEELAAFSIIVERSFVPVLEQIAPYMGDIAKALGVLAAKSLGIGGYAVGETARLFNEMVKQGGFSNFMENMVNSMMTPEDLHRAPAGHTVTVNQTNHVYSSADADAVVRQLEQLEQRARTRASKNLNNQGY